MLFLSAPKALARGQPIKELFILSSLIFAELGTSSPHFGECHNPPGINIVTCPCPDSLFHAAITPCVRIVVASVFHKNITGSGKLDISEALS